MPADNQRSPFPAFPSAPLGKRSAPIIAGLTVLAAVIGVSIMDADGVVKDVRQNESGGRLHLAAYLDAVGIATICDGIIRWPDGRPVKLGDTATPQQCEELVINEILPRARALVRCAPPLYGRANQARALIDLTYNVGTAGVCNGAIGTKVRAGDWARASQAILLYDKGTFSRPQPGANRDCRRTRRGWLCRIPGLTNRRIRNKARFDIARPAQGVR